MLTGTWVPVGAAKPSGHALGAGTARNWDSATLWHNIDRRYIAMGAAGWHISIDVLDRFVAGERPSPISVSPTTSSEVPILHVRVTPQRDLQQARLDPR